MENKITTLIDVIKDCVTTTQGITFVNSEHEEYFVQYSEIFESSIGIMCELKKKGINPRQEIIIKIEDNEKFIKAFWACILGGYIAVPISVGYLSENLNKLNYISQQLDNPILLTENSVLTKLISSGLDEEKMEIFIVEDLSESNKLGSENVFEASPHDIAFIQYSSGSTGNPKGVKVSHQNLICNINAMIKGVRINEKDKLLSWTPLTHDLGMVFCHILPFFSKIHLILIPTGLYLKNPIVWLNKASVHKATITASPNFGLQFLINRLDDNHLKNLELSNIRKIINGAEPISYDICINFMDKLSPIGLNKNVMTPAYGLAEATLAVTFSETFNKIYINRNSLKIGQPVKLEKYEHDLTMTLVSVGSPLDQINIRICDDDDNILPSNYMGHIQISGKSVTDGYYNNIKETETLFAENWLRTGDTGVVIDGNLYIIGRKKDLIIINGLNYYAHDIERVIYSDDQFQINKVVVSGVKNSDDNKEDVVVFLKEPINEEFVKRATYIKELVNSKIGINIKEVVPVDKIHKTTSGKLKRFEMKNLYEGDFYSEVLEKVRALEVAENNLKSRNENTLDAVEQKVLDILKENFNTQMDLDTNFSIIGIFNSLSVATITAEIESKFNIRIPLDYLFSNKTPRDISNWIKKEITKNSIVCLDNDSDIITYSNNNYLSSAEQRMFIINSLEKNELSYSLPWYIEVNSKLNKKKFENSLLILMERHDLLRTSFRWDKGQPIKKVHKSIKLPLSFSTFETIDIDLIMDNFIAPFDLSKALLFRIMIVETKEENKYHIFGDFHHIIADRISIAIFIEELLFLLEGKNDSKDLLPIYKPLNISDKYQSNIKKKQEAYWLNYLSGDLPTINLPYDYYRNESNDKKGNTLNFSIDKELTSKIKNLVETSSSTMFMIILSVYNILLSKLSNQEEILVGTPISIREHGNNNIGIFINTIVFRSNLNDNKSYNEYLKEIREMSIQHYENKQFPFDELVNLLKVNRYSNRNPIFDTMLLYNDHRFKSSIINEREAIPTSYDSKTSKFDLTLEITEINNELNCKFNYNKKLFNESTIINFKKYFKNILNYVLNNPNDSIGNIPHMDDSDIKKVVLDFNKTNYNLPDNLFIDQLIERQAELYPDKIALVHEQKNITYKELNNQATALAIQLQSNNVGPDDVIPLVVDRSLEMIIGILGILKSGAAYLPIDANYPKERILYMVEENDPAILLTNCKSSLPESIEGETIQLGNLTLITRKLVNKRKEKLKRNLSDLAYIIYTSGSTGNPKGVMIEHKSILNLFYSIKDNIPFQGRSVVMNLTTISFDIFIMETLFPLALGKKVVIINQLSNSKNMGDIVRKEGIDIIQITPSRLKVILDSGYDKSWLSSIKDIIIGGESLSEDVLNQVQKLTNAQIYNVYGPTETTVWSTLEKIFDSNITIGKPIYNTQIFILDENLKPVPFGVTGEIYISGDGLARGYFKQPELSDSRFFNITIPFMGQKRVYKTGDLGAWSVEGDIRIFGRVDNQIKLRGYRIEPNEIRKKLLEHENIIDTVVTFNENLTNENCLCAYVVQRDNTYHINYAEFLSEKLPNYMIPTYFIPIDSLQLTPNGKLNVKALPSIEDIEVKREINLPQTELEEKIALIWEKVLNKQIIDITQDFFKVGGSSIKAIKLEAEIEKELTPIQEMFVFKFKTIQLQAAAIEKLMLKIKQNQ